MHSERSLESENSTRSFEAATVTVHRSDEKISSYEEVVRKDCASFRESVTGWTGPFLEKDRNAVIGKTDVVLQTVFWLMLAETRPHQSLASQSCATARYCVV